MPIVFRGTAAVENATLKVMTRIHSPTQKRIYDMKVGQYTVVADETTIRRLIRQLEQALDAPVGATEMENKCLARAYGMENAR